jgi:catechol 2,3-dioxygenase-like lactoylglutathione lyase family enzyme
MIINLNQVTLSVNNMDEATRFYLKLGFTQSVDTPGYWSSPVLIVCNNFNHGT